MTNEQLLYILGQSYGKYLESGNRSNAKLKPLHGAIANDIRTKLNSSNNNDEYFVQSITPSNAKEMYAKGRYIEKRCDIGISKNNETIATIEIKFVMGNYKQNSINYFYSMLGETANLRANRIKCYEIIFILDKLPYFRNTKTIGNKIISKIESINAHDLRKYQVLSNDDPSLFFHTPNKTLLVTVQNTNIDDTSLKMSWEDFKMYQMKCEDENRFIYSNVLNKTINDNSTLIYNDYELFINKVVHQILGD